MADDKITILHDDGAGVATKTEVYVGDLHVGAVSGWWGIYPPDGIAVDPYNPPWSVPVQPTTPAPWIPDAPWWPAPGTEPTVPASPWVPYVPIPPPQPQPYTFTANGTLLWPEPVKDAARWTLGQAMAITSRRWQVLSLLDGEYGRGHGERGRIRVVCLDGTIRLRRSVPLARVSQVRLDAGQSVILDGTIDARALRKHRGVGHATVRVDIID